jgi:murein DD-endopeptidase MepM/ murein hydrolase activator NlpD
VTPDSDDSPPTPDTPARTPGKKAPFDAPAPRHTAQRNLPGAAAMWFAAAALIFAIAAGLAFGLNGDDDDDAIGASAAPAATPSAAPPSSSTGIDDPDQSLPSAPPPIDDEADGQPSVVVPDQTEPAPAPAPTADPRTGFALPIGSACLPDFEGHLPGSPRDYRNGTHEGVDFYGWASCTEITLGTAVLAAKAGTVIRADVQYEEITAEQLTAAEAAGYEGEAILDTLRGRQIWIDHGDGVITRYAHLSAVAFGIERGAEVEPGRVIGFVGESGTPESVFAPGTDYHLHFEVRLADSYLGAGGGPLEGRAAYVDAFVLSEDATSEQPGEQPAASSDSP